MKLCYFLCLVLVLWGNLAFSQKIPLSKFLKTTTKMIKKGHKITNGILSKMSMEKDGQMKKLLRFRDQMDPEAWKKVEKSVKFFRNVKKALLKQNVTSYETIPDGWIWNEILWCKPSDEGRSCHSHCQKKGYEFMWCFIDPAQNHWRHCSCEIRPFVRHWIQMAKNRLMKQPELLAAEKKEIARMDIVQWVVIAILAFLVTSLVAGIGARVIFNYRKAQLDIQPNIVVMNNMELEEL